MLKLKKLQQVKFSLTVSVTILFVILYFVFYINKRNQKAFQSVTHSAEVIVKLEQIYSRTNELESAQRGYIITKEKAFLEPYERLNTELHLYVRQLEMLVCDYNQQLINAQNLRSLIDKRLKTLEQNLVNAQTENLMVGKLMMTEILSKIRQMKEVEEVLMKQRLLQSRLLDDKTTMAIIISIILSSIFIFSASLILIQEYKLKSKIEQELLLSQKMLRDKVNKLDASNKELEQFAYIASHDLQEPLRKIITFNERIAHKFSSIIDPSVKDYLGRTIHAAERMRILIDDLLNFSRITKGDIEMVPVSLKKVMDMTKENLEVQIKKSHAKIIQHNGLPDIHGDQTQLVRLFQNLISNAIKFTESSKIPIIEIFCTIADEKSRQELQGMPDYSIYYKITIRDNGIGFSEEFSEKIFIIFQRLHGRSEYEGTGIGLSICKKIVENHQGYITVNSEVGKGSEFNVYLPKTNIV
ncbi:MAG: ATP-binding protein [Bacteroidota bacterium]